MPYTAEISRRNPSCFLFLIDRSGSMADSFSGQGSPETQKAQAVADAVNRLIDSLGQRCVKGNEIYDYFDVGVIGYSSDVSPAFNGALSGRTIAPISTIYENPSELENRIHEVPDGMGGMIEVANDFPVWFKPMAHGGTAMCGVFDFAHTILAEWVDQHPNSYPPTVINITDGESTDGDPREEAENLKQLHTNDGNVLLYNIHLSSEYAAPVCFPNHAEVLNDPYAKLMYELSSILPSSAQKAAENESYKVSADSRAFMFNADPVKLIQFLDIGTRVDNLR
ncbi:von Willebrand factor type A [Thalassoporum mexicanum PCC 7367]|uniref:vWA domain-containing protein n=1 Tax=Thalassoporum mexicanum TaxID=3457544 RepID=UPI0002A000C4|nr:vWA domain-containing protein [Pseudanabaena sp. PCC 7367]AFY68523.1 von Willebrand factor type A [Pseudanabaena sp. PCC 7367]